MKIRIEMEIDLKTGNYDVRLHNLTHPGNEIDLTRLSKVVNRVLDNVAVKTMQSEAPAEPTHKPFNNSDIN